MKFTQKFNRMKEFSYPNDSSEFGNFQFLQSWKSANFYSKIFSKLHANNIRLGDPVVYCLH